MPIYSLSDLDARVLDRLDNNALLYPTPQRYGCINQSLKVINLFSPFVMGTIDVPGFSIAGQQFYPIPAGIIFPLRIYFNGRQLSKVSLRSLTMRFRNWATDMSNQGMPVQEWIPLGLNMFGIHPMDSVGGQTLSVNGVIEPPLLVSPSDTITIEDEYLEMVEDLTASVLQVKESTAIFGQASLVYNQFQSAMKDKIRYDSYKFRRYFLVDADPTKGDVTATK